MASRRPLSNRWRRRSVRHYQPLAPRSLGPRCVGRIIRYWLRLNSAAPLGFRLRTGGKRWHGAWRAGRQKQARGDGNFQEIGTVKRAFDFVLALLLLLVFLIPIAMLIILVRVTSPGAALYW